MWSFGRGRTGAGTSARGSAKINSLRAAINSAPTEGVGEQPAGEVHMFCPSCGTEYGEGLTVCSKCNVALVGDSPPQDGVGFIRLVTVYETGNPATISFVKSILESEGIRYHCKGEGLQELFAGGRLGTGYNPITGPVEIQVDERDAEKAKEILSQVEEHAFEQSEGEYEVEDAEGREDTGAKKSVSKILLIGIMIGILISGAVFFVDDYRKKHFSWVAEYDHNKDSKPDFFYYHENGVVVKSEWDRNFDGKVDVWCSYKDGNIDRCELDNAFNGRITAIEYFKNWLLLQVDIDTNNDGKPDIIEYYTNGIITEKDWYHETSQKIWRRALYARGIMREEYVDQDYDGTFDIKILHNSSERPIKVITITKSGIPIPSSSGESRARP
jgi:hypothetical protein